MGRYNLNKFWSCLAILVALVLWEGALQQVLADDYSFLPLGLTFQPLLVDPREPHWAIQARPGFDLFDLDLGGDWDIERWSEPKGDQIGLGLMGGAALRINRVDWATYLVRSDDWMAGVYQAARMGILSWRIEYRHENSDLGDDLFGKRKVLDYRRQGYRLVMAWQILRDLRIYGGFGDWIYQSFGGPGLEALAGLEVNSSVFLLGNQPVRAYLAYQIQDPGRGLEVWDQDLQIGLGFGTGVADQWPVRLFLLGHWGRDVSGQFYQDDDSHIGFGVALDP